jgi:hypothetical protein
MKNTTSNSPSSAGPNEVTYDPTQDYLAGANPNGVWSYGFGAVGGDFTLFSSCERIGPGEAWWHHDAYGGFYRQTDDRTAELRPAPQQAVKIRFTAPEAGWYATEVRWTSLRFPQRTAAEEVQEEVAVAVYTNGTTEAENDTVRRHFDLLFSRSLNGYERTAQYENERIWLNAGESLSFEVDSGGDGHYFDDVRLELVVRLLPET